MALSCVPVNGTEIRKLDGVQPVGTPVHVSRMNASPTPPLSPFTMLAELELNATNLPSGLREGLAPPAGLPSDATEMSVVFGLQLTVTPRHVSRRKAHVLAQTLVPGSMFVV